MTVGIARQIEIAQRRNKAVQMRLAGMSYPAITEALGYKSSGAASKDVTRALRAASKAMQENSEELLQIEIDRLDRLMAGLWTKAIGGDTKAVETIEKIIYRRCQLLGLDLINRNGVSDGDVVSLLGTLFAQIQSRHQPTLDSEVVYELDAAEDLEPATEVDEAEEGE
ncbi:hypothetical protein ABZ470_39400 [Streptosporangium sp. NPDC020072]|uniref:hypothetical protein n=1 Tax=Streptosporangium sp. NPDC020072 TaxID=3154788 RepID=UPI003426832A